jgi:predicted RNA polymerase sigma factor
MAGTRDGGDPPGGDTAVAAGRDTPPASGAETSAEDDASAASRDALAAVFREEGSRLTASVMRVLGDFAAAEEVVQDAPLAAWQQWPVDGVPRRPGAWMWTVARRRAVDVLRRDVRHREKLAQLAWPAEHPSEPPTS